MTRHLYMCSAYSLQDAILKWSYDNRTMKTGTYIMSVNSVINRRSCCDQRFKFVLLGHVFTKCTT